MRLKNSLRDLAHLFYPVVCDGCGSDIISVGSPLCLHCISSLPHTNFHLYAGNPIEKIFYGRYALKAAHSEFYFSKAQLIQILLHQLKYKGNKTIGIYLGKVMGSSLLASTRFTAIDYIIPLPMFKKKEFRRGYNQASIICTGVAEVLTVPILEHMVLRIRATETQTRKHRTERWENVAETFIVKDAQILSGKHILLVDDVLTTGATLEACCECLGKIAGIQISIATLAFASK